MNITYHTTWDGKLKVRRFYALLTLAVEQPDVGQSVNMYLGFQKAESTSSRWDIARCKVPYDGNVNLPYRYYEVSDHWANDVPYYGGLDDDLLKDKQQSWGISQRGSNSTCPGNFQKCIF